MSLLLLSLLRFFVDFGPVVNTVYAGLGSLIFTGYIVFDTWWLLKRASPDDAVFVCVILYLDIINSFHLV